MTTHAVTFLKSGFGGNFNRAWLQVPRVLNVKRLDDYYRIAEQLYLQADQYSKGTDVKSAYVPHGVWWERSPTVVWLAF